MKTLSLPEPKSASEAKFIANIIDRAETLFSNGYKVKSAMEILQERNIAPTPEEAFIFGVYVSDPKQSYRHYTVDGNKGTCTCPCFEENGFCKHYLAVQRNEEQAAGYTPKYAL